MLYLDIGFCAVFGHQIFKHECIIILYWILQILLLTNSGLIIIACTYKRVTWPVFFVLTTRVRKYVNRPENCAVRWRGGIELFFFYKWFFNEMKRRTTMGLASIRAPSVDRYCTSWTDRKEFAVVKQSKCASRYFKIIIINND